MSKIKQMEALIEGLEIEDVPEGNTLIYIEKEVVHLLSNIGNEEQMAETLDTMMSLISAMIVDLLSSVETDGEIPNMAQDFVNAFEMTLSSRILKSPDLIDKFLQELRDTEEEESPKAHIDVDKKMMH